jgi:hypothetical protein
MITPNIHERSFATTTLLSQYWNEDMITPDRVISVLNEAGVSFVLVGAYGVAGWLQDPRATQDVDVVVAAKHHKKALRALLAVFPDLEEVDFEVVTRLRDKETKVVAIDVMKPNQQLIRAIFKNATTLTTKGQQYRVPSLEMAIAMKFAAMTSPNRQEKDRHQDAHDFIGIVQANANIGDKKLSDLGELVYGGGGKNVLEMVRKARAGETLNP